MSASGTELSLPVGAGADTSNTLCTKEALFGWRGTGSRVLLAVFLILLYIHLFLPTLHTQARRHSCGYSPRERLGADV